MEDEKPVPLGSLCFIRRKVSTNFGFTKVRPDDVKKDTTEQVKAGSTTYKLLYKKKNILQLGQGSYLESSRQKRKSELESKRRSARMDLHMQNRKLPAETHLSSEAARKEAVDCQSKLQQPVASNSAISRREKLMKWKKEKEVLKNLKSTKPPPFKPPGKLDPVSKTIDDFGGVGKQKQNRRQLQVRNVDSGSSSLNQIITRSMSAKTSNDRRENCLPSTIRKIETLTLNKPAPNTSTANNRSRNVYEKPSKATQIKANNVGVKERPHPIPTKLPSSHKENTKMKPERASKLLKKNQNVEEIPEQTSCNANDAQAKAANVTYKKGDSVPENKEKDKNNRNHNNKAKPQEIDSAYIDFSMKFTQACDDLHKKNEAWTPYLEDELVPEAIKDEIRSSLGQVKLLLKSKLPQFGQLLYYYLCKESDPGPILECDLHGWWDVASIQIEAVQNRFQKLYGLKKNEWKEKEKPVSRAKAVKPCSTKVAPKNSTASEGIRAFLAKKRQQMHEKEENTELTEVTKVSVKSPECSAKEKSTDDKLEVVFDGGFFTVDSPLKTCPTASLDRNSFPVAPAISLNLHQSLIETKSGRRSSTRTSLKMLSVRRSMASLSKIGASSMHLSNEDKGPEMSTSTM